VTMQLMPTYGLTKRDRSWAIGALDCAAWDLHGQWTGRPVAALLARQPAQSVAGYASLLGFDLAAPAAASVVERVADEGWAFTKWGLRAGGGDGHRLARTAASAAAAAGGRAAFDAVGSWTTELGLAFSATVDVSSLIWLEDPTYTVHRDSLASLRIPLALGERLLIDEDPENLLSVIGITAFTIDVVGCGGLTRARHLVGLARQAGIRIYPHGRSFMPGLQIAAAYPAVVPAVEYRIQWEPRRQMVYQEQARPARGTITVGDAPGLATAPRSA
jgi:L-alanine-DL-glutamate epimerase-like enolase superfamily enzyme